MTPEQADLPEAGFYGSNGNFLPRLGFAYTPSFGKWGTVIRGGYGEYIYPVPDPQLRSALPSPIFPFTASYSQSYTSAGQSPDGLPNYLSADSVDRRRRTKQHRRSEHHRDELARFPVSRYHAQCRISSGSRDARRTSLSNSLSRTAQCSVSPTVLQARNLDQNYQYNAAPSAYVWQTTNGPLPPTGPFASTATRPYDQTLLGRQRDVDEVRVVE